VNTSSSRFARWFNNPIVQVRTLLLFSLLKCCEEQIILLR
jgi:hypothetical protein